MTSVSIILDTIASPDGIVTSHRTIGDDIGRVICDAVLHSAHTHTVSAEPSIRRVISFIIHLIQ